MTRSMLITAVIGASMLSACTSVPVTTSPDDSQWRLRNFLDNGLAQTVRVYNFCYNGKESDFVAARDFAPGEHTVVTKITQTFNNIESKPKEAYATLKGDFEAGNTYVFQKDIEENQATLWIANVETGKAVSEQVQVTLAIGEVVDNEQRQRRRCMASTL